MILGAAFMAAILLVTIHTIGQPEVGPPACKHYNKGYKMKISGSFYYKDNFVEYNEKQIRITRTIDGQTYEVRHGPFRGKQALKNAIDNLDDKTFKLVGGLK